MNLAVVHYHLNRGGVAQVVINHLLALDATSAHCVPEQVVLCHGGRREGWPDELAARLQRIRLSECEIPELDYDEATTAGPQPGLVADRIQSFLAARGCRADDTILHVHNHALGKNVSLPGAVRELAQNGFPLLLQLHDFAEDLRPFNYRRLQAALSPHRPERLPELLYPQAPQIHYAVLNGRDADLLRSAGVEPTRLHRLPNPARPLEHPVDRATARARLGERFDIGGDRRYVVYPVRGIRRKNLGEFLLWAAVAGPGVVFGVTLPPLNPREQPRYAHWRTVADELRLPCLFEVGGRDGLALAENFAACDRVMTTSLAEGYGLVFLEANLALRPLIGRDLPELTTDFVQRGVTFRGLQARLDVPVEWLGRQSLLEMLAGTYNSTRATYGLSAVAEKKLEEGLDGQIRDGRIDFGILDATLQERVLRTVCGDRHGSKALLQLNPWLRDAVTDHDAEYFGEAERNAVVLRREYSLAATGRHLSEVYHSLRTSSRRSPLEALPAGERIVDTFLSLSRFRPVLL